MSSDFWPILQIQAPRARFERTRARAVLDINTAAPLPVYEMLADPTTPFLDAPAPLGHSLRVIKQNEALEIHRCTPLPRVAAARRRRSDDAGPAAGAEAAPGSLPRDG